MTELSQDIFIEVSGQELQGFCNGHHCDKSDDIEADNDVLRTNMEDFVVLKNSTNFFICCGNCRTYSLSSLARYWASG